MKRMLKGLGLIALYGSGLVMFMFWFLALTKWLGVLGSIIAFVVAPGLVIFPLIYWIVEGVFPLLYFAIWGVGILGMGLSTIFDTDK